MAEWQIGYAADCKSVYLGSTPGSASKYFINTSLHLCKYPPVARVVKLVDTRDLKSLDRNGRAGSSPAPGTIYCFSLSIKSQHSHVPRTLTLVKRTLTCVNDLYFPTPQHFLTCKPYKSFK